MKPSVYIETTVPSYYHETRRTREAIVWRQATREWWDKHRLAYSLYTSSYVFAELRQAPRAKSAATQMLLQGITVLPEPTEFEDVVGYYIQHHLMPGEAKGDAAHLALASLHRMSFLLTWNIRHLANANKIQHMSVLNARLGLPVPIITTPMTLVPETLP